MSVLRSLLIHVQWLAFLSLCRQLFVHSLLTIVLSVTIAVLSFFFFLFLFLSFFFVSVQFDRVFSKTEWSIQMHAVSVDIQWGTPLLGVTAFERVAKHTMWPLCSVRTHVNLFQVCYTLTLLWYNVTAQALPLCFMVISKMFCRCYCSYIQHDRISGRVSNMLTWIEWAMFVDFYTYSKLLSYITRSTMCSTTGLLCGNSW